MDAPVRIAMWSGPRTLSTALMRSWGNRGDTAVVDEPFYAHYLRRSGSPHPGRDEILATYNDDWRAVVAQLCGPVPGRQRIWYQKHMTHHITEDIDLEWLGQLRNCFLIRSPAEVISSYARVRAEPTLMDLGLPQQWRLFTFVRDHSASPPPVIEATDLLRAPESVLQRLCAALGVDFTPRMLAWPPGPRETDGTWARFWYDAVERSTGFAPYRPQHEPMPARFHELLAAAEQIYGGLAAHRLRTVDA